MYCPIMSYQKTPICKVDCSTDCAWNQNGCLVAKALIAVAGSEIPGPAQATEPKYRPSVSTFPWLDR